MCACGCFLIVGIAASLIYFAMHGLWPAFAGIVVFSAVVAWLGRKAVAARNPPK